MYERGRVGVRTGCTLPIFISFVERASVCLISRAQDNGKWKKNLINDAQRRRIIF